MGYIIPRNTRIVKPAFVYRVVHAFDANLNM
jgi:hypothetical protein